MGITPTKNEFFQVKDLILAICLAHGWHSRTVCVCRIKEGNMESGHRNIKRPISLEPLLSPFVRVAFP